MRTMTNTIMTKRKPPASDTVTTAATAAGAVLRSMSKLHRVHAGEYTMSAGRFLFRRLAETSRSGVDAWEFTDRRAGSLDTVWSLNECVRLATLVSTTYDPAESTDTRFVVLRGCLRTVWVLYDRASGSFWHHTSEHEAVAASKLLLSVPTPQSGVRALAFRAGDAENNVVYFGEEATER